MPRIRQIPAICYATSGDISPQIAPPYDVLDEGPKRALLSRSHDNIVAIDLPVTPPKTLGPDSAYEQAGQTLQNWLEKGTLQKLEKPCLFAYEQEYEVAGRTLKRRGVFVDVEVQPFNQPAGVFQHEHTIRGGLDDRYKLMCATNAQLSPIFGIFNDPQGEVAALLKQYFEDTTPDYFGTTDNDGVIHRCWKISDDVTADAIVKFFEPRNVFIADGHHRYTTAMNYHEQHAAQINSDTCLFVLVAAEDEGMIVLPTHRVLCGLAGFDMAKLIEVAGAQGLVIEPTDHGEAGLAALTDSLPDAGHHAMGLYDPQTKQTYLLKAQEADPLSATHADKPAVWRELDVAVLHELLIDRIIRSVFGGEAVSFKYTADLADMQQIAAAEPGRLAVMMQATPLQSVCDVSLAGEVMPPKSTFFYPKVATGLVVKDLGEEVGVRG